MNKPVLGADFQGDGQCVFTVWAPKKRAVSLVLEGERPRELDMERMPGGYWRVEAGDVQPGAKYRFRLNQGKSWPDPASQHQPERVFGPSAVVDHKAYSWNDKGFVPPAHARWVIYELHVGTFTPQGTLQAAAEKLDHLADLGVTAVELMPLAQFSGSRNWGYDGVFPFAVHNGYGGSDALKAFVDACHARSMAVVLDVVYNHLGPEGNCLGRYGPYFHAVQRTPWGGAFNYDEPLSDPVRHYVVQNMLHWFTRYHVDGLRLDAVQAMVDTRAEHILAELARVKADLKESDGRPRVLIAESEQNDPRMVTSLGQGGLGMDGQWLDDFHHPLQALICRDRAGFYKDYGHVSHLVKSLEQAFVLDGCYSAYRKRGHGASGKGMPGLRFVAYSQNHDMVGNRPGGERIIGLAGPEGARLAAFMTLFSPFVPMLFMGEEWGETRPFHYFTDHQSKGLNTAVAQGRLREYRYFGWNVNKARPVDPHTPEAFERSLIDWSRKESQQGRTMLAFYRECLGLRKTLAALSEPDNSRLLARPFEEKKGLLVLRGQNETVNPVLMAMNFSRKKIVLDMNELWENEGPSWARYGRTEAWVLRLYTADKKWGGPGHELDQEIRGSAQIRLGGMSAALYVNKAK